MIIEEGGFYIGKSKNFDRGILPNLSRTITTSGDNVVYVGGGMSEIKLKKVDTLSGGRYETWYRIMRDVYSDDGLSPTIHTCGGGNMEPKVKVNDIIRKLTPRECFRLMAFTDKDFDNVKAVGMSDSQCYKQAGNSIVVTVLEAICKEIIG